MLVTVALPLTTVLDTGVRVGSFHTVRTPLSPAVTATGTDENAEMAT